MKNHYQVNDEVWIHINGPNLVKGTVVSIVNLETTLYVIQIPCHIEPFYEVRNFYQISDNPNGPIALFNNVDLEEASGFLEKVGISIPKQNKTEKSTKPYKKYFRHSKKKK